MVLFDLLWSFVLGLLTPLTAVCVIPLYPGFIAFLSNRISGKESRLTMIFMGLIIAVGVITFMLLLGLIFTTLLEISLTVVIGIISPIAFAVLLLISILLIFNVDIAKFVPRFRSPTARSPYLDAFLFGFFFGPIVIPCNPAFIAAFFAKTLVTTSTSFIVNMLNVLMFGFGIAFPLVILAFLSATATHSIIAVLTKHKKPINLVTGIIMLIISLYYLIFVFKVFAWAF